jgi:hypothetical protein
MSSAGLSVSQRMEDRTGVAQRENAGLPDREQLMRGASEKVGCILRLPILCSCVVGECDVATSRGGMLKISTTLAASFTTSVVPKNVTRRGWTPPNDKRRYGNGCSV